MKSLHDSLSIKLTANQREYTLKILSMRCESFLHSRPLAFISGFELLGRWPAATSIGLYTIRVAGRGVDETGIEALAGGEQAAMLAAGAVGQPAALQRVRNATTGCALTRRQIPVLIGLSRRTAARGAQCSAADHNDMKQFRCHIFSLLIKPGVSGKVFPETPDACSAFVQ
jgi:hypothetical protein